MTLNILNLPHCYETSRLLHFHISRVCYCSVCDETQKSAETGYGTFFGTKFSSRPIPRLFSVLNFPKADSGSFPVPIFFLRKGYKRSCGKVLRPGSFKTETKYFRDRLQEFFRCQFVLETDSKTFLVPIFLRPVLKNSWLGNSRDWDVTLFYCYNTTIHI